MTFIRRWGPGVLASLILTTTLMSPLLVQAQGPDASETTDKSGMLLTIFLRHDESKPLTEIKQELRRQGFFDHFPPPGTEVVSWYVMMGIGQVVTLRVPPDRLRDVNVAIENGAWGAFHTEFYPTYDYRTLAQEEHKPLKSEDSPPPATPAQAAGKSGK